MTELRVITLGPPRLELDGRAVQIARQKSLALLVYLAVDGEPHTRAELAGLLWPDYPQPSALAYLRRALWGVKQALGSDWLDIERETLSISSRASIWLDCRAFRRHLAGCSQHSGPFSAACADCVTQLEAAVALYQADFLAGFSLPDSPSFEEWQFFQAEELRRSLALALERLVDCRLKAGEAELALGHARRWLALDNLDERAQRQLLLLYSQTGQRSAAVQQYESSRQLLQAELGIEPEPETTALYHQIKNGVDSPLGPQKTFRQIEATAARVKLPPVPTQFIGRQEELQVLAGWLSDPERRLITLSGPGGVGKTRLAIHAAGEVAGQDPAQFPDGVYFVPLAPVEDPGQIPRLIADAVDFCFRREQLLGQEEEDPLVQLSDFLQDKHLLLVLDNFEQLVAGGGILQQVMAEAPGVRLLVTSRTRLNIQEEWVLPVEGLPVPDQTGQPLEAYSAGQLFLQAARHSRQDFNPTQDGEACVLRICELVDGVPLGIELAAAWVRLLPCTEIVQEIERSLDFLETTQRDRPARHHSIRAVFEHSWNLLSQRERSVFKRLSQFRTGFDRAAGAVVAGAPLPLLAALVDQSLLHVGGDGRFRMHELVRQFAAERLAEAPQELAATRSRLVEYYSGRLEKMYSELRGPRQLVVLSEIELELEDIRAAWRFALENKQLAALEQMGQGLALYYAMRGRGREGDEDFSAAETMLRQVVADPGQHVPASVLFLLGMALAARWGFAWELERWDMMEHYGKEALALSTTLPAAQRARLAVHLRFGFDQLPLEEATRLFQESRDIFRRQGDEWMLALAQGYYGDVLERHDAAAARSYFKSALEIFSTLSDEWMQAQVLLALAYNHYRSGEYGPARVLAEQGLVLFRRLGDPWAVLGGLLRLGQLASAVGEYNQARDFYQLSLDGVRAAGHSALLTAHLACLGHAHYLLGEYPEADALFIEARDICLDINDEHELGMAYGNLALTAQAQGQLDAAQDYFERSVTLLRATGERWGLSVNLCRQGNFLTSRRAFSEAWQAFREAFAISRAEDLPAISLEVIVGISGLLVMEHPHSALELLGFSLSHPATPMEAREIALHRQADLEEQLSETGFQRAVQRGRGLNFAQALTLVQDLIEIHLRQ